jgi:DNA-binding MarR family transcriptional regulator
MPGPRLYQPLADFRYGLRKFLRFSKDFLASEDLTPEQYEALLALKAFSDKNGLLVGELSERLQVRHHTAVSITDRLSARRFVSRHRDRLDQRKVYVRLTSSGSDLVARLAVAHYDRLLTLSGELIEALQRLKQ